MLGPGVEGLTTGGRWREHSGTLMASRQGRADRRFRTLVTQPFTTEIARRPSSPWMSGRPNMLLLVG